MFRSVKLHKFRGASRKGMKVLPNDVLLMVMEYLDIADILACRLTCKRLAGLTQHPALWRHQSWTRSLYDVGVCPCPVLRLAPYMESLQINTDWNRCDLIFTTRCAVEKLNLYVGREGSELAVLAIRNQVALGRLRHLEVQLACGYTAAVPVLETIVNVSGLETLKVLGSLLIMQALPKPPSPRIRARIGSTLKHFSWNAEVFAVKEEPTCKLLLATHTTTLETVDLRFINACDRRVPRSLAPGTVALLTSMPKLRVLRCYSLCGLEAVAACASLEEVTLIVDHTEPGTDKFAAVEFLRRAVHLRKIELCCSDDFILERLMLSLASSGRSAVESLIVRHTEGVEFLRQVKPLLRALPSLPALRHLELVTELPEVPEELLTGFTSAAAPALQSLRLSVYGSCLHACMHRGSFKEFLSANPSLQIVLDRRHLCGDSPACGVCSLECRNHLLNTLKNCESDEKLDWLSIVSDHEKWSPCTEKNEVKTKQRRGPLKKFFSSLLQKH